MNFWFIFPLQLMELIYTISNEVPKLGVFPSQERDIFFPLLLLGEKSGVAPEMCKMCKMNLFCLSKEI